MLKPIWALKLDENLTRILVEEINRSLYRANAEGIHTEDYIRDINALAKQIDVQLEENGIRLEEEKKFLVQTIVPKEERVPYVPPRTTYLLDAKPIGEIESYDSNTGRVIIHVQDPAVIEQIKGGRFAQLEVL